MDLRERITTSVRDIRDRGQRLVQLNLELLSSELKAKGRKFGAAIGLFAAAALLTLYALGFLLALIVVLIDLALPLWAAMLIVTVALFVLIAVLVLVGRSQLRKIGDAKPDTAMAEAKVTADMMKANARGTVASVVARIRPRRRAVASPPAEPPLSAAPEGLSGSPPPGAPVPPSAPSGSPPGPPPHMEDAR